MFGFGRNLWVLAGLIGAIALAGCADDPVTTPGGQPLVFSGRLRQGQRIETPLVLEKEGTIRIEATDLTPILIETSNGEVPQLFIGVAIGTPNESGCGVTFGETLAEGDSLEVLVDDPVKCLLFFDNGNLPKDAIIAYTVTVEDLKSN